MSELPKCLLCGRPAYRKLDSTSVCCKNMGCEMTLVDLTEQQWTTLMGRGEPVGWHVTYTNGFDFMTDDIDELGDADDVESIEPLYKHRAPAVDDAVLLDAAAYRWLIDSPRNGPVWNNVLTEEQRAGHCDVDAAIKAAMKGEG